jgi:hypothetical protein
MSLLECVVAASLLAILLSVVAANFLACQKVISRERLKRKGLLVAFKVTQNLMTIPFDRLPPEKFSGQEGTVKVKLSLPISGEVKAFKENGEDMPAYLEGDREVSVRVEGRSIFFVQYIASWNEGGWEVKVWGEFVDESLRESKIPTKLKRLFVKVERDGVSCPTLWLLRGK